MSHETKSKGGIREMMKFIAGVIIIVVLLIVVITLSSRGSKTSKKRTEEKRKEPQRQPKKDVSDKEDSNWQSSEPGEEKTEKERKALLQQIADLEKQKAKVQEGVLYQKELGTIVDSMQYLVGISRFLRGGGKLNQQQESNYFWYRIVRQCKTALDKKDSFDRKREALKAEPGNQYGGKTNEELKKIAEQLRGEVSDRKIALSCRAIMMELGDEEIIESLASPEQGQEVDWGEIQKTGERVRRIFLDHEIYFWFYDDREVQKYHLQSEFNEGSSIAIDVPAVFVKDAQTDSVKLLGGYIGVYTDGQ